MLGTRLSFSPTCERRRSGQHDEDDDPEGPEVALLVVGEDVHLAFVRLLFPVVFVKERIEHLQVNPELSGYFVAVERGP